MTTAYGESRIYSGWGRIESSDHEILNSKDMVMRIGPGLTSVVAGKDASCWFQGLSYRELHEGQSGYRFSPSHGFPSLHKLQEDLSTATSIVEQMQAIVEQYIEQGEQESGVALVSFSDDSRPDHSDPMFQLMSDGVLFRFTGKVDEREHLTELSDTLDLDSILRGLLSRLASMMLAHLSPPMFMADSVMVSEGVLHSQVGEGVLLGVEESPIGDWRETPITDKEDFERLADEWESDRPRGVDLADMAMHPAYQQIIGMGPQAIPWLMERLDRFPSYWFWALNAITRAEDVVPEESQGNTSEMAEAWLNWGRTRGYVS